MKLVDKLKDIFYSTPNANPSGDWSSDYDPVYPERQRFRKERIDWRSVIFWLVVIGLLLYFIWWNFHLPSSVSPSVPEIDDLPPRI
jgi:hypothetical protein